MKLTFITLLCLFPCLVWAEAPQDSTEFYSKTYKDRNSGSFGKSHKLLSFSYGLPNTLVLQSKETGGYRDMSWFGPLIARMEFPIREEIGIAPQVSWYKVRFTDYVGGEDKASIFSFGTMGMYHFNKLIPSRKLDLYAGIGLQLEVGHVVWNVGRIKSNNLVTNGMIWQAGILGVVGARYYMGKAFAVFAEAGHPTDCYFDLGITFNLKK